MRKLKYLLFSFCVYASINEAAAQYTLPADPARPNITQPSPDVWQFARYGNYPVSRETGVPDISIPIYTLTSGELSVPISLSYHASGNKVDEPASWVGLGWTLNAGGVISRTAKGAPDEGGHGILTLRTRHFDFVDNNDVIDMGRISKYLNPNDPNYNSNNYVTDYYNEILDMMNGIADSEPDVFNYNFPGYGGRFFLDPSTMVKGSDGYPTKCKGVSQPKNDLDITAFIEKVSNEWHINKIEIITQEGVKFVFDQATVCIGDGRGFNSSWHLGTINSPNSNDVISFYYSTLTQATTTSINNYKTNHWTYKGTQSGVAYNTHPEFFETYGPASGYGVAKVPVRIECNSGKIVFNTDNTREDYYYERLASIDIFNTTSTTPVKSFVLDNNHYFIPSFPGSDLRLAKRLKLVSIRERGSDQQLLPPYEFAYLENNAYELPPLYSAAQDWWGYYNGQTSNTTLVPIYDYKYGDNYSAIRIGTAVRDPNSENMKAGLIQTIRYPTGGVTEFSFEPNDYSTSSIYTPIADGGSYQANVYAPPASTLQVDHPGTYVVSRDGTGTVSLRLQHNYDSSDPNGTQSPAGEVWFKQNGTLIANHSYDRYDQTFNLTIHAGDVFEAYASAQGGPADHPEKGSTAFVTMTWSAPAGSPQTVWSNKMAGGLRVASVKNYDVEHKLINQKNYTYTKPNSTASSAVCATGKLPSAEDYLSAKSYKMATDCGQTTDWVVSITGSPQQATSLPLSNTVIYEYVTETEEAGTTGRKSVFKYDISTLDAMFSAFYSFSSDRSWLRGQLLNESHYINGVSAPYRTVQYTYDVASLNSNIAGFRVAEIYGVQDGYGGCFRFLITWDGQCIELCTPEEIRGIHYSQLLFRNYSEPINWKRLISKTETVDGFSTTTTYEYDPVYNNVLAVQTANSQNLNHRTEIRYATQTGQQRLMSMNMVGVPLESDVKLDNVLIGGSRLTYNSLNGFYVPKLFEERLTDGTYKMAKDIRELNAAGRIQSFYTKEGLLTSIQWGYQNTYPVMKVVNAQLKDILYDSFEEAGGVKDVNAKTGSSIRIASYNLSLSNLTDGKYVLSYSRRTNGIWQRSSSIVDVAGGAYATLITASSATPIDELRFYPVASQMTTYTFDPLIGMTSMTDPNSVTTYYQFDTFNRLKFVKDNNQDILKSLDYQYRVLRN